MEKILAFHLTTHKIHKKIFRTHNGTNFLNLTNILVEIILSLRRHQSGQQAYEKEITMLFSKIKFKKLMNQHSSINEELSKIIPPVKLYVIDIICYSNPSN